MNTSTSGSKSFAGSVNLRTLALSAVAEEDALLRELPMKVRTVLRAAGEKARVTAGEKAWVVDARARASADLAMFMMLVLLSESQMAIGDV